MKKLSFLGVFTILFSSAYAQNVGIGTNNPDPSAKLEVSSNTSGFLPPRMTFAQRNAIANPAPGLMIFCTDCGTDGEWQGFKGGRWLNINGTTASIPNPPVDNTIPSVIIGSQVWSTKNLCVARYRNGDPIPQVTDPTEWRNLTTGAWCWYNNDSATYGAIYGKIYNWFAVNDARGLAPQGWHIPSDNDWGILIKYTDPNADTTCRNCTISTTTSTAIMSTTGWSNPTGGSNATGFSGLPGGARYNPSTFSFVGSQAYWWSSSPAVDGGSAYYILQNVQNYLRNSGFYKNFGYYVRVVKDTLITIVTTVPTLSTDTISSITTTAAQTGGNITSDGGASISDRGLVWSTSQNPTISLSTKTTNGSGTGAFTGNINGLTPNTAYYVRAYATNSVGTAYGEERSFSTVATPMADTSIPAVTIGTQIWSTKNLDVARYRNGDPIPQVTNATQWKSLTTGAWCWYNNDSASYAATYGRLYNWYAVNDPRGLAPQGWHVATDAEWTTLTNYLTTQVGAGSEGLALKSITGWVGSNTGATNSSGFTGLPGGRRNDLGGIGNAGYYGIWWSSTGYFSQSAWSRTLSYNSSSIDRSNLNKPSGFSVRIVKD
jgi:uncharacterized protein (TIGR02145 family)